MPSVAGLPITFRGEKKGRKKKGKKEERKEERGREEEEEEKTKKKKEWRLIVALSRSGAKYISTFPFFFYESFAPAAGKISPPARTERTQQIYANSSDLFRLASIKPDYCFAGSACLRETDRYR